MTYEFDTDKMSNLLKAALAGSTMRELTERLGGSVSPSTLSRLSRGTVPDMAVFLTLCTYLKTDPGAFFRSPAAPTGTPGGALRAAVVATPQLTDADKASLLHILNRFLTDQPQ